MISKNSIPNDLIKISLFLILIIQGCSGRPDITFDATAWKEDRNGCKSKRLSIYENLMDQKNALLGLSSNRIIDLLGKPNLNELFSRNQKFFIYRITPGKNCNEVNTSRQDQLYLVIRFNALGLASEIYLNEDPDPTI